MSHIDDQCMEEVSAPRGSHVQVQSMCSSPPNLGRALQLRVDFRRSRPDAPGWHRFVSASFDSRGRRGYRPAIAGRNASRKVVFLLSIELRNNSEPQTSRPSLSRRRSVLLKRTAAVEFALEPTTRQLLLKHTRHSRVERSATTQRQAWRSGLRRDLACSPGCRCPQHLSL